MDAGNIFRADSNPGPNPPKSQGPSLVSPPIFCTPSLHIQTPPKKVFGVFGHQKHPDQTPFTSGGMTQCLGLSQVTMVTMVTGEPGLPRVPGSRFRNGSSRCSMGAKAPKVGCFFCYGRWEFQKSPISKIWIAFSSIRKKMHEIHILYIIYMYIIY